MTRGSFNLDADEPRETVEAVYSKRRREDRLPLRPETAVLLKADVANKLPAAKAFKLPPREHTAKMLRADLDAARAKCITEAATSEERSEREQSSLLAYQDHAGLVADFHSLRHTFISNLARAGVHPKLAQSLARHSDINLTMSRYTHTTRGEQSEALAALPDLSAATASELRATGMTDATASADVRQNHVACYVAFSGAEMSNSVRDDGPNASAETSGTADEKSRGIAEKTSDSRRSKRRGRDSNPRYRFTPYTGLANRRIRPLCHLSG